MLTKLGLKTMRLRYTSKHIAWDPKTNIHIRTWGWRKGDRERREERWDEEERESKARRGRDGCSVRAVAST